MSRVDLTIAVLMALVLSAAPALAQENPHLMTLPDGSTDAGKCAYCHNDDLTLARSKAETCTLCHAESTHSGSLEHIRASAAAVQHALRNNEDKAQALPLTDDRRIYCGTCHLFHDPKVMPDALLSEGRPLRSSTVNRVVRQGITERLEADPGVRAADGNKSTFNEEGTRYLRLPDADGTLCRHCHGAY